MKPLDKIEIHCIEWEDAQSVDAWGPLETVDDDCSLAHVYSIGAVVHEDKKIVQLALNLDVSNEKVSCLMNIPKINIKSRRKLCLLTDLRNKKTTRLK